MTPTRKQKLDAIEVKIDAIVENERIIQIFPYGELNQEHCIHGIKLRWSCDDCEEMIEAREKP